MSMSTSKSVKGGYNYTAWGEAVSALSNLTSHTSLLFLNDTLSPNLKVLRVLWTQPKRVTSHRPRPAPLYCTRSSLRPTPMSSCVAATRGLRPAHAEGGGGGAYEGYAAGAPGGAA